MAQRLGMYLVESRVAIMNGEYLACRYYIYMHVYIIFV